MSCDLLGSDDDEDNVIKHNLTVSAEPIAGGSVNLQNGEYEENSELTITATANEGWEFINWTGGVNSSSNPLNFTITDNMSLTANFQQVNNEDNSFTYDGDTYSLEWGEIYDYGEFTEGFRNYDFVLAEDESEPVSYYIYLWFESLGAASFDAGTYVFSNETINSHHLYEGELTFMNNGNEVYLQVISGEVVISISGSTFNLDFDLMLENNKSLTGNMTYDFEISDETEDTFAGKTISHVKK